MDDIANILGLLMAFLPLFVVVIVLWSEGRQPLALAVFVTIIITIAALFIVVFPVGDLSMLTSPFESDSMTMGIPNDYFGDYIHINETQNKTMPYHVTIIDNATMTYYAFPLYGIETYDFNQSDMKFHKSQHNLDAVNFSLTITKSNFSYTFYPHWNTSYTYDFTGIPNFYPLKNNDTVNFTYQMNTNNLSSEFNQTVFLFPFKAQTKEIGQIILPVEKPQDYSIISYILISCSVTCSVLSCTYLFLRQRREQQSRERNNLYWREYAREQRLQSLQEALQHIQERQPHTEQPPSGLHLPTSYADYHFAKQTPRDKLQENIDYYRDEGYWTKVVNISPQTSVIYISNWTQDKVEERGIPQWRKPRQQN